VAIYFFHLRDGTDVLLDPDGHDVADAPAVRAKALKEARALISAEALEGRIDLTQRIDVEDAAGALVHRLGFADAVAIVQPS
jgi:hypothetical protein